VAGGSLALLIFVSIGWLTPPGMRESGGMSGAGMSDAPIEYTYRALIEPLTPPVAGAPTELDIKIVDQFDTVVSDYDFVNFGKLVIYAYLAVASRDLSTFYATPLFMEPASARELLGDGTTPLGNFVGMMDGMGGADAQPPSPLAGASAAASDSG
ncbi:MAG TPA: hypothetical protein DCL15_02430, partial [Chloroflexi bacterium]|nr:hypothetical protein [Chloroflexota bacterium]